jgi:negative regulator of flagellin synthesis FlgM
MKIPGQDFPSSISQSNSPAAKPEASASGTAKAIAAQSSSSPGVAVTVSNLARGLEKASRSSGADVDVQKVATVKASIQDGTFVVNPEAIADKLLSNAQEMFKRTTN